MAVTDSSELKSRYWPGDPYDSYHYQSIKQKQAKTLAREIYHPEDKGEDQGMEGQEGEIQVANPQESSSVPKKKPSLQKVKEQIDHGAPRGFLMNIPPGIANTGDVVGNITLDLYRLLTLPVSLPLNLVSWGGKKIYRAAKGPVTPAEQQQQQHNAQEQALKLVQQIENRVDLDNLKTEDGEKIPEPEVKARLFVALAQKPEFRYLAAAVLPNSVGDIAAAPFKWFYKAPPHLPTLVEKLVNLDFSKKETPDSQPASLPSKDLEGGENPILERARHLDLDVGHSETQSVCHELEASGSIPSWVGRGLTYATAKGIAYPTTIDARKWMQSKSWHQPLDQREMSEADFAQAIKKGKVPPTKDPHRFAVLTKKETEINVYPKGVWQSIKNLVTWSTPTPLHTQKMPLQVHSVNGNLKMLLAMMTRGKEAEIPDFAPDTVVSVKVRNTRKFKEKVLQPLVDTFRVTDKVRLKNGKMVEIKEACLWPFIEAVLTEGENGLGPNCTVKGTDQKCFDLLADAKVFKFKCSDKKLEKFLNERLRDKTDPVMRELRAKLAVIQVISMQYAEQVDIKETVAALAKGAVVGIGGETMIEHLIPHPKEGKHIMSQGSYWANWALMSLVDAYDNWQGEQGSLEADLKGMGLKNTPKDVYGQDQKPTIRQRLKLFFKRDADGPAGMSVGTAQFSAVQGAALGGLFSLGTAIPFSKRDTPTWELSLASGTTALGTALSIPLNYGYTKPRVMMSYNEALKAGRLKLPADIDPTDEKAVKAHIDRMATQDMMARIGLQASAKAYTVVAPAMASLWALRALGYSRETVQALAFGLTPGAENASRGLLTAAKLYKLPVVHQLNPWYTTFHENIDDTERMTLLSMLQGNEHAAPYRNQIRQGFNDFWSRRSAGLMGFMTNWLPLPVPIQPVLTHKRKIDYVKPEQAAEQA